MKQNEVIKLVLELIQEHDLADKIRDVLSELQKPCKERTSNGYEIYYDESNGEAVGIVYKNLVFLKSTSSQEINWYEAVEYCKTVVINGIQAQLCPVEEELGEEFRGVAEDLYKALQEIGAENLDDWTWCSEYSYYYAWIQRFSDGSLYYYDKYDYTWSVRPVLVLK